MKTRVITVNIFSLVNKILKEEGDEKQKKKLVDVIMLRLPLFPGTIIRSLGLLQFSIEGC